LTDFARLQMSERLPRKLCTMLVVRAVEEGLSFKSDRLIPISQNIGGIGG
jgi:hypothetical protein